MTIRRAQGIDYERIAVQTHLIHIKEPLEPVFDEYVKPVLQPGDWLAVSEKFVTISQGRVIHHSVVRPGVLAKLLVKGVTKHPDDVGYSDPRKMQVAIMQAGWWRMLFAMIGGAISRIVLRRRGDFYRIAGHRISEIDGFSPATVKPFDEFAMLGPSRSRRRGRGDRGAHRRTRRHRRRQQHQRRGPRHEPGFPADRPSSARCCSTTRSARTTSSRRSSSYGACAEARSGVLAGIARGAFDILLTGPDAFLIPR